MKLLLLRLPFHRAASRAAHGLKCLSAQRRVCPEVWAIEAASTLTALWWTLLLWGTPRIFATSHLFAGLAGRGEERQWGVLTALLTLLGLRAMLGISASVRFFTMAISFVLWLLVTLNLAQAAPWVQPQFAFWIWKWHLTVTLPFSVPESTGVGVYGILAGFSLWTMGVLAPMVFVDAHKARDKHSEKRAAKRSSERSSKRRAS